MNLNKVLIQSLTNADVQQFTRHLEDRNKRKEGKNIALFKALLKGKEHHLKEKIGSNHYHVLNKRLSDRLIDYTATQLFHTEVTVEIAIIKLLLVARNLLKRGEFKSGFDLLSKAREEAKQHLLYPLLSEIYHTSIEYSYHSLSEEQSKLFEEYELNRQQLEAEEKLNMAYALIRKAFYEAEHQSKDINLKSLFDRTFEQVGLSSEIAYSFKSLYQLSLLADIKGAISKDYYSVDLFFLQKLNQLQKGADNSLSSLKYHIALLYLIANIYFRKKDFGQSLHYLAQMKSQMSRYDGKYYVQNEIKYLNLMALNHHFTAESKKAIDILKLVKAGPLKENRDLFNSQLIRIMIHFHHKEWQEALKLFAQLQQSDKWYEKNIGLEWLLNKKYIEILLHIELGNIDYVDSRIQSLVRIHGDYFKKSKEFQVLSFLKLVKKYCRNPHLVKEEAFHEEVEKSIEWKPHYQEDLFLMCFYAWLKSKMVQQPLYEVTLELLNQK